MVKTRNMTVGSRGGGQRIWVEVMDCLFQGKDRIATYLLCVKGDN